MNISKEYRELSECNMCGKNDFEEIFFSERMPLTGLYIPKDIQSKLSSYDQTFLYCNYCGHGQLKNIINPEILYDDTYTHRSSESAISTAGNDFFYKYLQLQMEERQSKSMLEVGCNDLYLIKKIQNFSEEITGLDPIWIDKDFSFNEKTNIKGKFIHELSKDEDFINPPDLIVSAHTFEHVSDIYDQFKMLCEISAKDCRFVIEIPSFETMVNIGRYDQVFHQHLQYTSLSSMIMLINRLGCRYIDHVFNYDYWGGTLLFTFEKANLKDNSSNPVFNKIKTKKILNGFSEFKSNLLQTRDYCENSDEPVYGFGAAQMLPLLAHHMESDLSFLHGIIDDNQDRVGSYLPSIKAKIISPADADDIKSSIVMLTALDSTRPILKRLLEISPRRIFNPLKIF
jgi:hypothetical protein